jgi:iron complex transport system permease protein
VNYVSINQKKYLALAIILLILSLLCSLFLRIPDFSLLEIRAIRSLLSFFVGASLALSGLLLQTLFQNPLVEPFTIGIAGAASIGAAVSILMPFIPTKFSAFISSLVVILFMARLSKRTTSSELLLTGLMISFLTSAIVTLLMGVLSPHQVGSLTHWMLGGVEGKRVEDLTLLAIFFFLIWIINLYKSNDLNALLLGEESAKSLGIDITKLQLIIYLSTSILTSITVSIVGLIGFIGLLIPHLARLLFGNDHRILLFTAPILGGLALLITDGVMRFIWYPLEFPLGAVTAVLGAPFFLFLLIRRRVFV